MRTDFVITEIGTVHSRANWEAMQRLLSPAWRRILGDAKPYDPSAGFQSRPLGPRCTEHRIPIIADGSMPSNSFELRSGDQRVRVRWPDEATEIDRWADDGGRAP